MVALSAAAQAQAAFRAVILGAPGSGKGTVSHRIAKLFGVCHISTGDRLRYHIAKQTELGKQVKEYLDSGKLVPDDVMMKFVSQEIKLSKGQNWLLDGFPRTVPQAEMLDSAHPPSLVINLTVPDAVILERVKNRWIHVPSGRVYNIGFSDPKVPGKDDVTGEPLTKRRDDQPEIVQRRLHEYEEKTRPVIDYYDERGLLRDFAGVSTDELWPQIKQCLQALI
ncbi:GTP:AMP phosphotransferase AK3, mitochondrial [Trichogramma pretiosum]|uniref:GTP:AMP phosphotransferase AK3, mitochondrial n=1 Tax=Trichogramma pretiosum TaxID=7493 RepID=UPI0006C98517|nr:GTP:AMP phosphotransferase AK3, mitochondrial [Trichogramma pretiosum]